MLHIMEHEFAAFTGYGPNGKITAGPQWTRQSDTDNHSIEKHDYDGALSPEIGKTQLNTRKSSNAADCTNRSDKIAKI